MAGSAAMKWYPYESNRLVTDSGAIDSGARDSGEIGSSTRSGDLALVSGGGGDKMSVDAVDTLPLPDGVGVGV